ncbi:MAG: hypothetical protein JAZ20_08420 [Candidatus Thiodiazotropha weberae]|nr:hypothetical protein [Candidatus Thiodiazotropha lotti]MCG8012933.1 hypothetical protein [Candidatus Thiodiazotropha lotti]MCG8020426.1 hypothetical protein [Candidatus Thiodiazotropha lotti]MCW4207590.1 hypothetical protein [Candidatus Thiodiazotropha lotti]MCW4212404.1 hypothetical protein [Candidatus Thiodiazotropha lotti]
MEISGLVQIAAEGRVRITMQAEDQEREMVGSTQLMLVAIGIFNHDSLFRIRRSTALLRRS